MTDVDASERRNPGPPGAPDVRVLTYSPQSVTGSPAGFLHIHGGGYIIGRPEMTDARNRLLAREIGCVVVSVDYRLAPGNAFPGAVEDCCAGLRWLHAQAEPGASQRRTGIADSNSAPRPGITHGDTPLGSVTVARPVAR